MYHPLAPAKPSSIHPRPSSTPAGFQCYLAWLAYFYLAMALRENVLVMNGSSIRSWWIQHHYWSAATVLLLLSLPINSPCEQPSILVHALPCCWQALLWL